jgi:hypothetical protein
VRAVLTAVLVDADLTPAEKARCVAASRGTTSDFWANARPGEVSAETVLELVRVVEDYLSTTEGRNDLD